MLIFSEPKLRLLRIRYLSLPMQLQSPNRLGRLRTDGLLSARNTLLGVPPKRRSSLPKAQLERRWIMHSGGGLESPPFRGEEELESSRDRESVNPKNPPFRKREQVDPRIRINLVTPVLEGLKNVRRAQATHGRFKPKLAANTPFNSAIKN
jgi:hypothetical protein